jgi:hypothetical protein
MTGPPYPHPNPAPGSNAIGSFVIGVSPIGDIAPFDPWVTVISQYANSPVLTGLIVNFAGYADPTANFDEFFDAVWNIDSAQGYGLDVWGRIVGVSRTIRVPNADEFLGFEEGGDPAYQPFNVAPFYTGVAVTDNFDLTDTAFRSLILTKAAANISNGSIPAINQLLLNLFPGRGNCYVKDNNDMSITYFFQFFLSAVELGIIESSGVLPTPTGVSFDVVQSLS